MKDTLTPKQRKFVEAYLSNGQNATEAAISAGYSPKGAAVTGSQTLRIPKVAAEIASRTQKAVERVIARTNISVERTLEYVGRLAFYDPRDLFEEDGSLKRLRDMTDEARTAIAGLEITEIFSGEGEQKHGIGLRDKVKLADRRAALDMLMRYHSQYRDKLEITGEIALAEQISKARARK